jgi:hypothetical protein
MLFSNGPCVNGGRVAGRSEIINVRQDSLPTKDGWLLPWRLVVGGARATQSQTSEAQDALEMSKRHLNTISVAAELL